MEGGEGVVDGRLGRSERKQRGCALGKCEDGVMKGRVGAWGEDGCGGEGCTVGEDDVVLVEGEADGAGEGSEKNEAHEGSEPGVGRG